VGSDKELDHAIDVVSKVYNFLTQSAQAKPDMDPFPALTELIRSPRLSHAASVSRPTS
jgi:flagellar biosynthesis/type III secretory pathway ATPase